MCLFIAGAVGGRYLGATFAPSSTPAVWSATLMLPASLVLGSVFWRGLSILFSVFKIIGMIFGAIFRAIAGKPSETPGDDKPWHAGPGAAALIIMPVIIASITGAVIYALVDKVEPIANAWFAGGGLIYGLVVYLFARLRLLPMGESIVEFRS